MRFARTTPPSLSACSTSVAVGVSHSRSTALARWIRLSEACSWVDARRSSATMNSASRTPLLAPWTAPVPEHRRNRVESGARRIPTLSGNPASSAARSVVSSWAPCVTLPVGELRLNARSMSAADRRIRSGVRCQLSIHGRTSELVLLPGGVGRWFSARRATVCPICGCPFPARATRESRGGSGRRAILWPSFVIPLDVTAPSSSRSATAWSRSSGRGAWNQSRVCGFPPHASMSSATPARSIRWMSGVRCGVSRWCSSQSRQTWPGPRRPARPARWLADASDIRSRGGCRRLGSDRSERLSRSRCRPQP